MVQGDLARKGQEEDSTQLKKHILTQGTSACGVCHQHNVGMALLIVVYPVSWPRQATEQRYTAEVMSGTMVMPRQRPRLSVGCAAGNTGRASRLFARHHVADN